MVIFRHNLKSIYKMKKFILLILVFFASLNLNAQTPTWVCMNVTVDQSGQADFVESLDNFMESL